MTIWIWCPLAFFMGAAAERLVGARIRAAGAAAADGLRYWWRRKRAAMRGEDPDAWRNEYVTVVINGIPQHVHPDELELAQAMQTYLADGMSKLLATAPPEDLEEAP